MRAEALDPRVEVELPAALGPGQGHQKVEERLAVPLGWRQSQITQIVLRDSTDDANGSATAIPVNTLQLFVTAPDDLSVLEQYDDWLETLVTHEYAHILHTDHITGLPAIVNAIIDAAQA